MKLAFGIKFDDLYEREGLLREDAARFLTFLCGEDAAAVFAQHKFVPLRCR